jgi:hypothetical protein
MEFGELLERLPLCSGIDTFPIVGEATELRYVLHGLPEFIAPRLTQRSDLATAPQPRVVIVSAAGAVGKSTLAAELAAARRAPLWDLALSQGIAGASLTGRLTEDFGAEAMSAIYQSLYRGELFLVIDALDEALMKIGIEGYQPFISNVARIANKGRGISFVLLERTQTAEDTWCLLDDLGVPTELVAIEPFDRGQACEFIRRKIRRISQDPKFRSFASPVAAATESVYAQAEQRSVEHAGPFTQARDLIFNHLEREINRSQTDEAFESAGQFLGYAPVLEAVAFLLAGETNYQDVCNSLRLNDQEPTSDDRDGPIYLLHEIVRRILAREQMDKVQKNLRPLLEPVARGWSQWARLYSIDEQCARLLGVLLKSPFSPKPILPPDLQARYDKSIAGFLQEHPFLRNPGEAIAANVVFESYLFARGIYENLGSFSEQVEQCLSKRDYKPSRLLADFYLLFMKQDGADFIRPQHLGFLYDSLLAGETDQLSLRLKVEGDEPDDSFTGNAVGSFRWERIGEMGGPDEVESDNWLDFSLPLQPEETIQFTRQLKQASIVVPCAISLGLGSSEFQMGPAVEIECRLLELGCHSLVVRRPAVPKHEAHGETTESAESRDQGVVLEALTCESSLTSKPVVYGELSVRWPGSQSYPWSEYYSESAPEVTSNKHLHACFRRFKRIILEFRSNARQFSRTTAFRKGLVG